MLTRWKEMRSLSGTSSGKSSDSDDVQPEGLRGTQSGGLFYPTLGFFAGLAAVSLLGPAAKQFSEAMQLSGLELGFLVAAPLLTGSLLRIPFGAWVEVAGGKRPMLVLLLLSLAGILGLLQLVSGGAPNPSQYPLMLLSASLCGCGVASFSVAMPQTAYWFPKAQQGRALGICGGIGNLAPGCFALLLPIVIAEFGLWNAYASWFAFLVFAIALYALRCRDAFSFQLEARGVPRETAARLSTELGQELQPAGSMLRALRESASIGHTWALVALYFTAFGGFLALVVWLPNYFSAMHGLDPRQAGLLTALSFALPSSLIRIYGGSLSDQYGGERVAMASFGAASLGAGITMASSELVPAVCALLLTGLAFGVASGAIFKLVAQFVPDAVGAASGWVGGLGAFGGFIIPPLLGALVDVYGSSGYSRGFAIPLALSLLSMSLIYRRFIAGDVPGTASGDAQEQEAPSDDLVMGAP